MSAADDARLAREIAGQAAALLIKLRATSDDTATLGARADAAANALILEALAHARPDDPILSEESRDDVSRCENARCWIVDPLDGTREYAEGRADWAVHIALTTDGAPSAGAVALPALDLVLASDASPALSEAREQPIITVSRSRPPAETHHFAKALNGTLLPMGSAGAKAMAVLRGEADIYIHSGGQYEWDSCAPVAVAQSAGLHCARLDGSPLIYNQRDTYLPDLVICHPAWADRTLACLAALSIQLTEPVSDA